MYHSTIHGLVIRDSFHTAKPQNPLGSGLRQCCLQGYGPFRYAATKPKARSPMGFLLFRVPWLVKGRRVAVRHGCTLVHRLFCGYLLELSAMLQQARTYTAGCVRGLAGSTPAPLTNQGVTRQGASANSLHGLNPRNTGTRYLREIAEQPVREGLRKVYGQSGDKRPVFRVNRGVMRTLGLFIFSGIKEDIWAGSGQIPWVSPLPRLWGNE